MKTRGILFVIASVVLFLVFLGGASGYAGKVRGITDNSIIMGNSCDMTGPTANATRFLTEGVRIYFEYINSEGGINGRKFKVVFEDDRYSVPAALAAFKKLVYRDGVFAIIGPQSTGGVTSLFRYVQKEKVPLFTGATSELIYIPPKRYVFGHGVSSRDEVRMIYRYILQVLKAKDPKIAIVYPDVEFGKYGRDAAIEMSSEFSLKFYNEILAIGSLDATSQILNLKRVKPDHIILHGPPSFAAVVMRDARKFGLTTKFFIGTSFAIDDVTVRMVGKTSENFIGTNHVSTWYDKSPGAAELRKITLRLRPGTDKPFRGKLYTYGWLAALIMTEGMKRAGKDLNSESMVKSLESIKSLDTKELFGPISFGPNDRQGTRYTRFYKADVENNAIVPFTDWIKFLNK